MIRRTGITRWRRQQGTSTLRRLGRYAVIAASAVALMCGLTPAPAAAVDVVSPTPSWTAAGEAGNDELGSSVASAGDVNNDGYSDVIVGAPYNNGIGKAYLYLGSPTGLAVAPIWTAAGEAGYNGFGLSVASAGDVNKDGYADVIVGASNHSGTGKAYLYLGNASGLASTPIWTASGEASGDNFGSSVASAGDVNKDGYADVIVGACGNSNDTGKSYLYFGSASGLVANPIWTAAGTANGDGFGGTVAGAGDVNKDGYADVIIGAPGIIGNFYNSAYTGGAYLYLGSASGLGAIPTWIAHGEMIYNFFGRSVSNAGDVNKDGYADVIVGAFGFIGFTGKLYLYFGNAGGLDATPAWTATGEPGFNSFGLSVAGAGDVNGDGYVDIVTGAPNNNSNSGKAFVYLDTTNGLSTTPAWAATGEASNDFFGLSVATAGDVNGDGYADVMVGAPNNNGNTGKAYVYYGVPTDTTNPVASIDTKPHNPTKLTSGDITFSATDGGSGVASYACALDSGAAPMTCTSPASYSNLIDGSHTFTVTATDHAGNTSQPVVYTWVVDTSVPPTPSTEGPAPFSNSPRPTFTFTSTDAGSPATFTCQLDDSAPVPCTSPLTLDPLLDGHHALTVTAEDGAGNITTPAVYSWLVDTTSPEATASVSPPPNPAGWYNTPVTVTFNATDLGAGLLRCTPPVVVNQPGASTSVGGSCIDRAGNSSGLIIFANIHSDMTPPVVTGCAPATPPDQPGWYTTPPEFTVTGSDDLSGIATCTAFNYTYAGNQLAASAVCTDQAGNTSEPTACTPVPYTGAYSNMYLPILAR